MNARMRRRAKRRRIRPGIGASELLLERGSPRSSIVFHLVFGISVLGLVGGLYVSGSTWTNGQLALLASIGLVGALMAVQGTQERIYLTRREIGQRWLGVWRRRRLPRKIRFEAKSASRQYEGLARWVLRSPASISIRDEQTGHEVAEIAFDMLAGMEAKEYRDLLRRLNRAAQQRDEADEA